MSLPARLFALGLCLAMPALAQGQPVKPAGGLTDCPVAVAPVRFCEADTGFHRMPQAINPDVNAFYEHSTGAAGMLIVETVGTADGLTLQMVRQNLIQNLADGGGVTTDAVLVWPEQTARSRAPPFRRWSIPGRSTEPAQPMPTPCSWRTSG